MWPVHAPGTVPAVVSSTPEAISPRTPSDLFIKDGRKIGVGDCALFQAGDAPPFIGIIRWFSTGKDNHLNKIGVNWIYRPADVKLAKGIIVEPAPNEVFYSFHKDVIPAASLLHPCKVAFLRKGVELPTGISSFVCRQVYDIANKCLWWLTDQDFTNELQEEVGHLLERTQLEMHAAVQSGGRSPKSLNGPPPTQHLKPGPDSLQNSGTSFHSQAKGKKREGVDQSMEPVKRERHNKVEDSDSISSRLDNTIKSEITKIAERGGLINIEAVEKLVHLMQLDRADRKRDLVSRVLFADVIAATDRFDCLDRFVQLGGLSILDNWFQELHKEKTGDGSIPKENFKVIDELLFVSLRALDKLPVNLNALQTCNIGKSVNHLRSHKNYEVQRKARSLIDTWKKRVDAEMTKNNAAKSAGSIQAVSWPGKPGFSEVLHAGSKHAESTELTLKSPKTQQSTCKALPRKSGHTDAAVKSTPESQVSTKLQSTLRVTVPVNAKDALCKIPGGTSASDLPLVAVKEEKSSSSSQSQNNSQSCSSDHVKTMGSSCKEDARSSTAGSRNAARASSRYRRSSNGFAGTSASGVQNESNVGKSGPLRRSLTLDKVSQSGSTCDRPFDVPVTDNVNSHRLIVRLPNPGCSPVRSASGGGSSDDPPMMGSRASSPAFSDKHDLGERKFRLKGSTCRSHIATDVNSESWQSNDLKEGLVGSDEGEKPSTAVVDDERRRSMDEAGKAIDMSRGACSSSENDKELPSGETITRKSFSSMNALIESCAKYSEVASMPSPAGDDNGVNLLATVAAGEMSKSNLVSSADSLECLPITSEPFADNTAVRSRIQCGDDAPTVHGQSDEITQIESRKDVKDAGSMLTGKITQVTCTDLSGCETIQHQGQKGNAQIADSSFSCTFQVKSLPVDESKSTNCGQEKTEEVSICTSDLVCSSSVDGCGKESAASGGKHAKVVCMEAPSYSSNTNLKKSSAIDEGLCDTPKVSQKMVPPASACFSEATGAASSAAFNVNCPGYADEFKTETSGNCEAQGHLMVLCGERMRENCVSPQSIDELAASGAVPTCTTNVTDVVSESTKVFDLHSAKEIKHEMRLTVPGHEMEQCRKSSSSGSSVADADGRGEQESSADAPSSFTITRAGSKPKLNFDLNEGASVLGDDVNQGECIVAVSVDTSDVHLPGLCLFRSSPITVSAPAKGPFFPPEDLLKSKGEPGWKGSAATSAFRPAEPRKILEMPLSTSGVLSSDTTLVKQARPPLDIDLNFPDDKVLGDMGSQSSVQTVGFEAGVITNHDMPMRYSGGLDLDLNRVDEGTENWHVLKSTSHRLEVPLLSARQTSGEFTKGDASISRGFDLNNGPSVDEVGTESAASTQQTRINSMPFINSIASLRVNSIELGNMPSWFPTGSSYPAVGIPSLLSDRGEPPYSIVPAAGAQRFLGPDNGVGAYGGDIYRGPILSSSPAISFSPATAFPYASFPFGSSFPIASTSFSGLPTTYIDSSCGGGSCFSVMPSQPMQPSGALSLHYSRPWMMGLPDGSMIGGGSESCRKWGMQGLDLNTGPVNGDMGGKDDKLSSASRQLSTATSQDRLVEQARTYHLTGAGLKRKEHEGVWDAEIFTYRQSWQ